jgi:polygalacturonase
MASMKRNSIFPAPGASLVLALGLLGLPLGGATEPAVAIENLNPARPIIPDRTFLLTDYGAVADGSTLNTAAFQAAVAAVAQAGGGRLVVPAGVFRTAPFVLCSNLDLHLEAGAVIQAPVTFEEIGLPDPATLKSREEAKARFKLPDPLISGKQLHDVAITGTGTIDGSGAHWWAWSERAARAADRTEPGRIAYRRPHLVVINGCERLLVADVTLTNSSMFHLVPSNITDLTIERIKVRAPFNAPNTDAIDPGPGTNFLIRQCDIDTGDDDIVIKSGGTNILIDGCTIRHGHGISIGSGTTLGIRNMLVRDCQMEGTDNGIRIKSMRGAGGPVENIRYSNITMQRVEHAFVFELDYVDNNRPDFKGDESLVPSINGVLIEHVVVSSCRYAGKIIGLPDSPIRNFIFRDVSITAEKDFVIKDADPQFDHVTRILKPKLMPKRKRGEH